MQRLRKSPSPTLTEPAEQPFPADSPEAGATQAPEPKRAKSSQTSGPKRAGPAHLAEPQRAGPSQTSGPQRAGPAHLAGLQRAESSQPPVTLRSYLEETTKAGNLPLPLPFPLGQQAAATKHPLPPSIQGEPRSSVGF